MAAATPCFGGFLLVFVIARVGDKLGGVERVGGGDLGFEVGGVSLWWGRGVVSRVLGGGGLVIPWKRGPIQTGRLIRRQQLSLRLLVLPAPLGLQASVVLLLLSPLGEGQPVSKLCSQWLTPDTKQLRGKLLKLHYSASAQTALHQSDETPTQTPTEPELRPHVRTAKSAKTKPYQQTR